MSTENQNDSLDFPEVELRVTKATIKNRRYELRELTGKGREEYLNATAPKFRLNEKGESVGLKDYTGVTTDLLARSLFDVTDSPTGVLVGVEFLAALPSRILTKLQAAANLLNGFGEKAEGVVKKD